MGGSSAPSEPGEAAEDVSNLDPGDFHQDVNADKFLQLSSAFRMI